MYQKWIDTYASDIFAESVETVMDITNEAVMSLPESDRAQILHHSIKRAGMNDVLGHGV